jgi:tRNA (guanine37-N1)-methyltransferase
LEINCVQIRDFTTNRQCQVDDYPYGGGWGCVMMAQPLADCVASVLEQPKSPRTRVIYLSPQGRTFTQERAKELVRDSTIWSSSAAITRAWTSASSSAAWTRSSPSAISC